MALPELALSTEAFGYLATMEERECGLMCEIADDLKDGIDLETIVQKHGGLDELERKVGASIASDIETILTDAVLQDPIETYTRLTPEAIAIEDAAEATVKYERARKGYLPKHLIAHFFELSTTHLTSLQPSDQIRAKLRADEMLTELEKQDLIKEE